MAFGVNISPLEPIFEIYSINDQIPDDFINLTSKKKVHKLAQINFLLNQSPKGLPFF